MQLKYLRNTKAALVLTYCFLFFLSLHFIVNVIFIDFLFFIFSKKKKKKNWSRGIWFTKEARELFCYNTGREIVKPKLTIRKI